jgi:hypothetical protein
MVYGCTDAQLIILSDTTFKFERIEKTTKDYYNELLKDSVYLIKTDSLFVVDDKGKIKNWP